jgi:hypothetical protein
MDEARGGPRRRLRALAAPLVIIAAGGSLAGCGSSHPVQGTPPTTASTVQGTPVTKASLGTSVTLPDTSDAVAK